MKLFFSKLMMLLIAIGVSLVLCEYCLRLLYPFTPEYLKKAPYAFSCYEPGSYYWLRYKRNTSCTLHSNIGAFADITMDLNSQGFRNAEIHMPKPVDQVRILFVGDSFITGWGVSERDTVPYLTGEMIRALLPSLDIETINAGLSASGQGYEYVFLKHEGISLNPDIIIVGVYLHNDIADSLRETQWSRVDTSGLPDSIGSSNSYVDFQGNVRRNTGALQVKMPIFRTAYLFDLLSDGMMKLFPNPYTQAETVDFSCVYSATCHTYDIQKSTMKKLFGGMHELANAYGKKLIVALLPSEIQVHPEHGRRYGIHRVMTQADMQSPHAEFIRYFQQAGIAYIDLLPAFQQQSKEPLYFTLDEHWTAAGTRLAATVISEYILDSGSIPSPQR